tara:strand:+ start:349 stop:969 length:621 start_codon:yes stop_codon:yes gene_type:complete
MRYNLKDDKYFRSAYEFLPIFPLPTPSSTEVNIFVTSLKEPLEMQKERLKMMEQNQKRQQEPNRFSPPIPPDPELHMANFPYAHAIYIIFNYDNEDLDEYYIEEIKRHIDEALATVKIAGIECTSTPTTYSKDNDGTKFYKTLKRQNLGKQHPQHYLEEQYFKITGDDALRYIGQRIKNIEYKRSITPLEGIRGLSRANSRNSGLL